MQGDVIWRLVAVPLTPIHVGDGSVIGKDTYDIRNGELCRFNPHRVIAQANEQVQRAFAEQLERGDLELALKTLRESVDDTMIEARLPLTREARRQLEKALGNPDRRGEVSPFIRSGGRPYIPGSSIKGAFRTALLSQRLAAHEPQKVERVVARGPDALQVLGFDLERGATETDPLRDVLVSDARVPDGALLVDRAFHWKPGTKQGNELTGMQIHVERLRSRADGGPPAPTLSFTVTIAGAARQERRARLDPARVPRAPVDADELWEAVRTFHWVRWDREREVFWSRWPEVGDRLAKAMQLPTKAGATTNEKALRANPAVALLRIGRFGHFESKSVEKWRQGEIPQRRTRRQPGEEGGTRMLATVPGRNGESECVPFGWMLLMRTKEAGA
jgi:CRISPR-associated protein Csm5